MPAGGGIGVKPLPTLERVREIVDYNKATGVFTWTARRFGVTAGKTAGTWHKGYRRIRIDGVRILAHRLAWFMSYERWPDGEIDHINMNRDDNRIENLRDVSRSGNMINRKYPVGKSGVTGVSAHRYGWQAAIRVNNKTKFLGLFKSLDAARVARETAAREIYGSMQPKGI